MRMHMPFTPRALLFAGAIALAASAAGGVVPAAQAAKTPGWRIVKIIKRCDGSESSVAAVGSRDAWVVGQPNGSSAACNADVEH